MNIELITSLFYTFVLTIATAFLFILGLFFIIFLFAPKMSGKERYISQHFAYFPKLMSNDKIIWLKKYYAYNTFGHGIALGGSVKTSYSKNKKYIYFSQRQGSFFPSTKTEWSNDSSYFNLRPFLKKNKIFVNKYKKKQQELANLIKVENFFSQNKNWKSRLTLGNLK